MMSSGPCRSDRRYHGTILLLRDDARCPDVVACDRTGHSWPRVCTAEKQMERRTGCLQSNDEFLQQTLSKLARETHAKITASGRALATAQAEIAALKSAIEKLNGELGQMKAKSELDRDDFSSNRHRDLVLCLSMIPRVKPEGMLFRKPVPTFRDHALALRD